MGMDKANQITSSDKMSEETVDFLKIQRALIEFAQQVGAERIGVEVNDKDSSANIVYGDKTDTIITTDNITYASQTTVIGTPEECRAAVEKQTAKKPDYEGDGYADGHLVYDTWICPCCGKHYEVDYDNYNYCPDCGQKLDWSDEE